MDSDPGQSEPMSTQETVYVDVRVVYIQPTEMLKTSVGHHPCMLTGTLFKSLLYPKGTKEYTVTFVETTGWRRQEIQLLYFLRYYYKLYLSVDSLEERFHLTI